jgi:hypothetical protein
MKRKLLITLVICSVFLLGMQSANAQTTEFTYQGRLNNSGSAANGVYDFEFALFSSPTFNILLGTVARNGVPVTNGVFSVNLDFGSGPFTAINSDKFLEIRVRPAGGGNYTVLSPRQPILTTPYAIRSQTADNAITANSASSAAVATNANQLGGINASQYVVSGASIINAGTQFNIGGDRVLISAAGNLFTGQGAGANTSGFGVIGNSFFGTVAGDTNVNGTFNTIIGANADVGGPSLTNATAIGARALAMQSNSLILGMINGVNGATADTNVGIGTTSPARRLHIASGSSGAISLGSSDLVVEDDAAAFQHFLTPDDIESGILFGDPSASIGGGLIFNNAATNNGIQFRAGGNTTRMTLDGSGNLGIGTTAPPNHLTVGESEATTTASPVAGFYNAGSATIIARDTTSNVEAIFGSNSNGVLLGAMTNHQVQIRTNNTARMTFFTTGNVNVGGTEGIDPNVVFAVNGTIIAGDLGSAGSQALCRNASEVISACSSSIRYKENVRAFRSGLSLVKQLRPVFFNWKTDGTADLGLVAEDVAGIEPLLTTANKNGAVEGVKYDRVGVVLINAVKEQQAQIEEQSKTIARQQAEIDALKQLVCVRNKRAKICQQTARRKN